MILNYLVRDVEPGTQTSYPAGRTLLNNGPVYESADVAQMVADLYNEKSDFPGIRYSVVASEETELVPCDQYESR